jgi:archaellum component FlaG (FlaF/FlaG flagellin family)
LKYTFVDNEGKNLFINSSWIQVFVDGKILCPTKYTLLNEYELQFTNGQELNSEIQIVTIG